jgi:hypothetical protein
MFAARAYSRRLIDGLHRDVGSRGHG